MKNSRIGTLVIIIFVVVAVGLAFLGPMFFKKKDAKLTPDVQRTKDSLISARGVVESEEDIEIASQVTGMITEIKVDEGDFVKKGQPLVLFDNKKILTKVNLTEAALKETEARLKELERGYRVEDIEVAKSNVNRANTVYEKARNDYERQNRLYQKDAVTRIELERAEEKMKVVLEELNESKANLQKLNRGVRKEEIEQAKAIVEKASSELQYYNTLLKDYIILSPIDGVVSERFKDPEETVDFGNPILKLINPKKLRIRAELEETDVGKVVKGDPVEVSTDSYKDTIYRGKVYKIFPVVKRKSLRTFDPQASLDINAQGIYINLNDFSGLKDGMTVTIKFLK
jgi:multidrug resistance efflux pump